MRVITLLGNCLLATCLFCSASDRAITPPISSLVGPSGKHGFKPVPLLDQRTLHLRRLARKGELGNKPIPPVVRVRPDDDLCYTMRAYIMVREDSDSDVTRRDGYVTCHPAWKFDVRTAVVTVEDH
jgi:hypothetical protein